MARKEYKKQVQAAFLLTLVPLALLLVNEAWALGSAYLIAALLLLLAILMGRDSAAFLRSQYVYFSAGAIIICSTLAIGVELRSLSAVVGLLPLIIGIYLYRGVMRWLNVGLSGVAYLLGFTVQFGLGYTADFWQTSTAQLFDTLLFLLFALFLLTLLQRITNDLRRINHSLKQSSEVLKEERNRYQTLFNNAPEAYFMLSSKDGSIIDCNHGAERMLGASRDQLLGKLPFELSPLHQPNGELSKSAAREMSRQIVQLGNLTFEWVHQRLDGVALSVEVEIRRGEYLGETVYFSTWRNIARRKELEARLIKLANEDQLTGLLNRHSIQVAMERQIAFAQRHDSSLALFFIDLDRFKFVNDNYGHKLGDQLLVEVSKRLKSCVRGEDLAARLGGDEFVLVFSELDSGFELEEIANKVQAQFNQPLAVGEHHIKVSISIGIATYPQDGSDFAGLLRAADTALYRAKDLGRAQHHFFSSKLADMAAEHLRIEVGIRQGLQKGQFQLFYQKQVNLADQSIYGIEALVRWNDPERGLTAPNQFLKVASETNQLEALELWIIEHALMQAQEWAKQGLEFGRMAVNLSAQSLQRGYAVKTLRHAIDKTGCPANLIEAEISENFLLSNVEGGISQLNEIRALGIELSLDDFGTGFSSLRYLKLLPINKLKIDQSFIRDLQPRGRDRDIVSATIAMAHKMNLVVIAEGVEREDQLEVVIQEGCDVVQGYIFSKPVPAEALFAEVKV